MKIFNILADLCQQQPNYIESFIEIIQNCIKPFLLDKSTDADIYSSALIAFYSDFGEFYSRYIHSSSSSSGYLLRVPNKRVQKAILETIFKSLQTSNKSPVASDDYDGMKPTTIEYIRRIQCASDLCETLVKVN